ncbi:Mediator of RNA polymerase II transcription subunit 33B [Glycine max]|nr:Mediator of RNA polymerase II transcription subunit 33B [Glycine max]
MLFFSYFKDLVGREVIVELKNDLAIKGTLHSVDQYLNIKLENTSVVNQEKYPHMLSVRNCFIRGSVVRYVQLPPEGVDIELLHDATRREARGGLKDLADFLPASLVTIASYFSAEDTRDIWKPAFMDGTDWISPAANLALVEQQIKKILAATGVDVPSLDIDGNSPATLPLPLAAFVSLTITYKLDKATERFLALIAPAVSALASGCSWPSLPIVTSLWIQMVKRWSNYFVLSASSTVFHHNKDAIVQLLKSCFTSTLGLGYGSIYNNSGASALLGVPVYWRYHVID